jgi:DNA-directed RNA polymerase II subunit RPB2
MDDSTLWKIIHSYFRDNPQSLVTHHIESYNDFFHNGIFQIFREKNPIRISSKYDETKDQFLNNCELYLGGKTGKRIYFGKPVIHDDDRVHYMYPNEARLRNMTYSMTIHYDVEVEITRYLEEGESPDIIGEEEIIEKYGGNLEMEMEEGSDDENTSFQNYKVKSNGGGSDDESDKPKKKEKLKDVDKMRISQKRIHGKLRPGELAEIREKTEKSMIRKNVQKQSFILEKIFLGRFPIMVQSDFCILNGLPKQLRYNMGECRNDMGGYFIIDGKEKAVIPQEKFADNMLYIRDVNDENYLYSAEIRSVSENVSKPIRTLSVKIVAPSKRYSFKNIVVNIPNVRKPVPLFIVFRALGFISDKEIITMCLLDIEKYESMMDLFIPSVHDAAGVMSQIVAIDYIAMLTKGKTKAHALEILSDYFFPHIGEVNFVQKAYYLGYVVFRLLKVYIGIDEPTNRDNFKFKRIEPVGSLINDLFREYFTIQHRAIQLGFEEQLFYKKREYENNLYGLIQRNYVKVFSEKSVDSGFKKAFKGNWGAHTHTKRIGVVQDLNRLSHNSMMSHLRKTNLHLDAGLKLVGPRVLHCSQWGYFDPIDTPDGGNIGLHKHLSISAYITKGITREHIIHWLRENVRLKLVEECPPVTLAAFTKVIVNGLWVGVLEDPVGSVEKFKLFRRNALIPIYFSISFDIKQNTVFIYTDAGRLTRPIFYRDGETGKFSFENPEIVKQIESDEFTWTDLVAGFNARKQDAEFDTNTIRMYSLSELYEGISVESNPAKLERFMNKKAIIDYIDTSESEDTLIALNAEALEDSTKKYTHMEIHESLMLSMMCNLIAFPENNPATRNSFSCGQSKQAVSMYHTNHRMRMDKSAVVLNNAQIPLVKTRYMEYINGEDNCYGENAIVAIMCYTGYNVEDAILVNEGSLKRGLLKTTYYSTYENHEEKTTNGDLVSQSTFSNIETTTNVVGIKQGYDYSQLDEYGLIREGTHVTDKTVLIGMTTSATGITSNVDSSKTPKKGQLGIVDKTFITEGEEGTRIAKVRVREERIPAIGDKMASRAGQKGTIGLVIPESDMPFTKDGLRPDLIINPHAIPSRMTIGQFVEAIVGKAAAIYGGFADCTAFNNKGSKVTRFGEMLSQMGYHSSGNDILYNGMTGEQIETEIFIGPTYYMRLKHMVKDKINYRALGPRTALTRQPVEGRANDGGLRIGEMERDAIISHGAANFLTESMMERGDKYFMAVCNKTGMIAIYNPANNLFMSPMADGPIRYVGSLAGDNLQIQNITKYGRSFSVVSIPYTLKLLIQELQTINIQMRVITEDNIDQIENMSYSKNIEKLVQIEGTKLTDIPPMIRKRLGQTEVVKEPESVSESEVLSEKSAEEKSVQEISPQYVPLPSPENSPIVVQPSEDSPPYARYSPVYETDSPPNARYSPGYDANSPDYASNSPPYAPIYSPGSEFSGGNAESSNSQYNVGDRVSIRGEGTLNPEDHWEVSNISPDFITIENKNPNTIDDPIRVVEPNQITPYQPTLYSQLPYPAEYYPSQYPNQRVDYEKYPPNINVAPIIKIVNGNDNSTAPLVEEDTKPASQTPNVDAETPFIIKKTDNSEPPRLEENNSVDFSKPMMIVKKG